LTSAEIYDPAANTWTPAVGDIPADGYGSTALSVLGNGSVLAAGGGEDGRPTSSAELFDPNRVWSKTGSMVYARSGAQAVTLADGSVMVVGGLGTNGRPLRSAERYDLSTGQWAVTPGGLMTSTLDQSAIPLKDGRVFVTAWPDFVFGHWSPADVQIFDPNVAGASPSPSQGPPPLGTWSSMPDIAAPFANYSRAGGGFSSTATATALNDGRVLVMGTGMSTALFGPAASTNGFLVAIYDPAEGRSQLLASPGTITSVGFTATLLRDGKVLVVGGNAELYDPATDRWSPAAPVLVKRFDHTATLLTDGRVLISGGLTGPQANGGYDDVVSADIYDPASNRWSKASDLPPTLGGSGATGSLLRDGRVLVVAGYNASAALYEPKSNRWSIAQSLTEPAQVPHSAILLANGKVLVLRGCAHRSSSACDQFAAPQLFDPATESWSPAAPMINGREAFSATLLANGHVLVAGGYGPESVVARGELYDPTANRWAATADMTLARAGHTATLLRNGSVLVIGGFFLGNLRSAELYTPPGAQGSVPTPSTLHSQLAGLNAPLVGGAVLLAGVVVVFVLARLITGRRRANLR
jgi:N-acetylneuraminic acid mutarotase